MEQNSKSNRTRRLRLVLHFVVRPVALANRKAAVFGQVAIRGWALFEGVLIRLIAWVVIELIKGGWPM